MVIKKRFFFIPFYNYCCMTVMAIMVLHGCTTKSDLQETNPKIILEKVTGGYRYVFTRSVNPIIYQAPIDQPIFTFESCEPIIGKAGYNALASFMNRYQIESVVISENKDAYLFKLHKKSNLNSFDAYVFCPDLNSDESSMIQRSNNLLPFGSVKQSMKLSAHWIRITPFESRDLDYMGFFDFK